MEHQQIVPHERLGAYEALSTWPASDAGEQAAIKLAALEPWQLAEVARRLNQNEADADGFIKSMLAARESLLCRAELIGAAVARIQAVGRQLAEAGR